MKIAIDCSKAVNESAGVARYNWKLASFLPQIAKNDDFYYLFNFFRHRSVKKQLVKKIIDTKSNVYYKIFSLPGNIKEWMLGNIVPFTNFWARGMDLYHAIDFLSFDHGLKVPQILTVHDLTFVKFPKHLGRKMSSRYTKMLRRSCEEAKVIIAVSRATKNDLIKYFSIPRDKIKVIYLGVEERFRKRLSQKMLISKMAKYKIHFPFVLFVGTIEPRKNIKNLLLAFDEYQRIYKNKTLRLVLIGKNGWNTREIEAVYNNLPSKSKVVFLDCVSDDDLLYFYQSASVFVYPSMYEGFGLPVLEAMASGVPVITSNISSLPEVGGKAVSYIDPNNFREIARAINKVVSDKRIANNMIKASFLQSKKFSWKKFALETYKVYEEVYKNVRKN